jgi:hypothetical protein
MFTLGTAELEHSLRVGRQSVRRFGFGTDAGTIREQ